MLAMSSTIRPRRRLLLARGGLALALLASGCAKKVTGAPQAAVTGEKQHAGSMLAYEHNVQLVLPAASTATTR